MTTAEPTKTGCNLCVHVFAAGNKCQSPALSDNIRCYFHARECARQEVLSKNFHYLLEKDETLRKFNQRDNPDTDVLFFTECALAMDKLELPILEDVAAIQVTLTNVVRALATQQMRPRTAGLILYAVQIASNHVRNTAAKGSGTRDLAQDFPVTTDRRVADNFPITTDRRATRNFPLAIGRRVSQDFTPATTDGSEISSAPPGAQMP